MSAFGSQQSDSGFSVAYFRFGAEGVSSVVCSGVMRSLHDDSEQVSSGSQM